MMLHLFHSQSHSFEPELRLIQMLMEVLKVTREERVKAKVERLLSVCKVF